MTTPPWHKFLDGRSGVLHIDRPATLAVDPVTVTYAVSVGGARDEVVAVRLAKPEGRDALTTLLRTPGLAPLRFEMAGRVLTKQPPRDSRR